MEYGMVLGDTETKEAVADGDESLEEERKKNLSILQSVLGSSQHHCSSAAAGKAKTFRSAPRAGGRACLVT